MLTRLIYVLLAAVAAVILSSCDQKLSDIAGPTPNLEPTFAAIQTTVFENADTARRVACTGCHSGGLASGGMNLTHDLACANIVNVPARVKTGAVRVIAGDPVNSYLVWKMEGRQGIVGLRMPFVGPPFLTDGQILIVKRWIALGAPQ